MKASRRFAVGLLPLALALSSPGHAGSDFYVQHNLVSDGAVAADHADANLVNAWGIAFNPFGFAWVADNGTGLSTLYDGLGNPQSLVVQIPTPTAPTGGTPTGIVFSGSTGFVVTNNGVSGPARFMFATEDGIVAAWAPNVDATHALKVADRSAAGAVYKGLALSAGGSGSLLYAADFHNGRIDVWDSAFKPVTPSGGFRDPTIPTGFAPFGLQAINGNVYVSYAKQKAPDNHDEVDGPRLGFVDVFDPNGQLIDRVASRGPLNAPWGMALAPAGFGRFSGRLLVANFGDGTINAFDLASGRFVGRLKGADHHPIVIPGLWGIAFGNGFSSQPVNTLFFAAGPFDEMHGLYGRLDVAVGDDKDGDDDDDAH
jgi:uncharacterized protein (TIGR03118 family)